MDLGSTIYKLRSAKNLSQEDLSELLSVSRQSVSKWENNTATPDLEKLIKLCDIFEISLDELAGRSKPEPKEPAVMAVPVKNPALTQRKIVGYLLLGLSLITALLFLFLQDRFYGSVWFWFLCVVPPLFCCSLVCLSDKNHAGYRCFWLVCMFTEYLFFELLLKVAIRIPFSLWICSFLLHIVILLFGVFSAGHLLRDVTVPYRKKCGHILLPAWIVYAIFFRYSLKLVYSPGIYSVFGHNAPMYFHYFACVVLVALLAVLFTATVLHLRSWRNHKKSCP